MNASDVRVLETVLAQLRDIDRVLDDLDAGVCALHLEACIAAMESRIIKAKAALGAGAAG